MSIKAIFPALAAVLLVGTTAVARENAHGDQDQVSTTVKYGDLDLSTQAGARAVLGRIHRAASEVCGPAPFNPLDRRWEYEPCVNKAIDGAVARLNSPTVTAMNGGKASKAAVALASR